MNNAPYRGESKSCPDSGEDTVIQGKESWQKLKAANIIIDVNQLDREKKILHLEFHGNFATKVAGERGRLCLFFQGKESDRSFPVMVNCGDKTKASAVGQNDEEHAGKSADDGGTAFWGSVDVRLEDVFWDYQPEPQEAITLSFWYCDLRERWICFDGRLTLEGSLFWKSAGQIPVWKKIKNVCLYIICTCLLPVWLLHGALACRGKGKLHNAAAGMQGKKALLYHAHGLVSDWTGYGYSIREMKTNYFCRCYQKACRKIKDTKGVLFLSERRVEKGGNLDLVRGQLQKEILSLENVPLDEFVRVKPVHQLSWKELQESAGKIAAAKVVVLEDFYPQLHALNLRRDTKVLQLWHACGAFKLFGLSDLGVVSHLQQDTRNHRSYTAAITSSEGIVPFYSEAFGIPRSHVKPLGIPRTDIFFDRDYRMSVRERLYEKYPVCQDRRVVLFAPTFRGSGNKTAYYPGEAFDVSQWMKKMPRDVVLIIKNHPFVKMDWQVEEQYQERVLNLSDGENINDLLFITCLLITDYSSVIFEAALLQLPMLFYVFDLEEYLATRNIYFDFETFVPGEIARTKEELLEKTLPALEQQIQPERYGQFCDFFLDALDGHSTERVVDLVKSWL